MAFLTAPPRFADRDFLVGQSTDTKPVNGVVTVGTLLYQWDDGTWWIATGDDVTPWAPYYAPQPAP